METREEISSNDSGIEFRMWILSMVFDENLDFFEDGFYRWFLIKILIFSKMDFELLIKYDFCQIFNHKSWFKSMIFNQNFQTRKTFDRSIEDHDLIMIFNQNLDFLMIFNQNLDLIKQFWSKMFFFWWFIDDLIQNINHNNQFLNFDDFQRIKNSKIPLRCEMISH